MLLKRLKNLSRIIPEKRQEGREEFRYETFLSLAHENERNSAELSKNLSHSRS
jgi:hypothetical protein